ncbi:MAG: U32 family peptidase [Rickettsiales bacterium]|jgi:putative protease|nr:U32 family peptidase [Rickettsiales bacterium]
MKKPELLLPAGSLERMKTAFLYGADAVYCGTPAMSLRAKSQFTMEEVKEGVELAKKLEKKVYLTLNLFAHNKDLEKLPDFVATLRDIKPHGVIVADPAVFMYLRENAPELNLHASTQSSITSWKSVEFWKNLGAKMAVLAREVSIPDMKIIKEKCPDIKIETFIHGSMCMSYSGRCLLSNFLANRGANQGKCAHCCRWLYKLHIKLKDGSLKELIINENNRDLFDFLIEEEHRPGDLLEIVETENMSNILNSKDLCLLPKLPEFINSQIDCLKVEGRNKTQYYVALVAKTYRRAIDDYMKDPDNWNADSYLDELYSISNRGFSLAFADGDLGHLANNYDSTKSISEYEFAGYITAIKDNCFCFLVKNKLVKGDNIEFISPKGNIVGVTISEFVDSENGDRYEEVNSGLERVIDIPFNLFVDSKRTTELLPILSVARKRKNLTGTEIARIKQDKESYRIELGHGG